MVRESRHAQCIHSSQLHLLPVHGTDNRAREVFFKEASDHPTPNWFKCRESPFASCAMAFGKPLWRAMYAEERKYRREMAAPQVQ